VLSPDSTDSTIQLGVDGVLQAWREPDALKGSRISWGDSKGRAAGIDDTGALLVETDEGRLAALQAGEVHLTRGT